MGDITGFDKGEYAVKIGVTAKQTAQVRDNPIEAVRQYLNRHLQTKVGKEFYLEVKIFPHHILRENRLASGAGADRTSSGMKHSFGKSLSRAAQVKKGKVVAEVRTSSNNIVFAKTALKRFSHKLPNSWKIEVRAI